MEEFDDLVQGQILCGFCAGREAVIGAVEREFGEADIRSDGGAEVLDVERRGGYCDF